MACCPRRCRRRRLVPAGSGQLRTLARIRARQAPEGLGMNRSTKSERFVAYLGRLDRGALAELRRGVRNTPGSDGGSIRIVEPFVADIAHGNTDGRIHDAERAAYYLVAGLYASKERAE